MIRAKHMTTFDYELWDLTAGNLIGVYPNQAAALAEVRNGIRDDGVEAWCNVGLGVTGAHPSESRRIAMGDELVALALSEPGQAR